MPEKSPKSAQTAKQVPTNRACKNAGEATTVPPWAGVASPAQFFRLDVGKIAKASQKPKSKRGAFTRIYREPRVFGIALNYTIGITNIKYYKISTTRPHFCLKENFCSWKILLTGFQQFQYNDKVNKLLKNSRNSPRYSFQQIVKSIYCEYSQFFLRF